MPFITPLIPFLDNFGSSFTSEEFLNHFYDSGFPLSNASKPFNNNITAEEGQKQDSIEARNQAFLETGIPFRCLLEDKPTYMALVGRHYFTVGHKFGDLRRNESDEKEAAVIVKDRNHW